MADVNDPTTAEVTPEVPIVPQETGAEPVAPPVSELADFRAAREAERQGEVSEEAPVEVETKTESPEAESDAVNPAQMDPQKHIYDPDTGEVLDRRSRSAKRIEALLRERYALRQQLSEQEAAKVPQEVPEEQPEEVDSGEVEPRLDQFSDAPDPYAAFTAANARWHARQEYQKQTDEKSTADRTAHVEARIQHAQATWDGKLDEVRQRLPDFDQAYNVLYETLPTDGKQRPLVETLLTSPIGHDMAHYLGTNPKAVMDLYNQPTLKAHLRAIGKLEAQIEAKVGISHPQSASTPVDTPPPPMHPVGAGATPTNYDSRSATLAQFRKRHGVRGGRRVV